MKISRLIIIVSVAVGLVCLDGFQIHAGRSHNRHYVPHHVYKHCPVSRSCRSEFHMVDSHVVHCAARGGARKEVPIEPCDAPGVCCAICGTAFGEEMLFWAAHRDYGVARILRAYPVHVIVHAQHPVTGNTVLHILVQHGYVGAIRPLFNGLTYGKTELVSVQNYSGDTAVHCAARQGFDVIVDLLLRVSGHIRYDLVNACNNSGETALYCAAERGYPRTVAVLLRNGADGTICNGSGVSPAAIARINGFTNIAALIEESCRA